MIPVHKLLLKFSKDKHVNKDEYEIAVAGHGGRLVYYDFKDMIIDKDDSESFKVIDENDNFIRVPYARIKRVLQNEKPVWEGNI